MCLLRPVQANLRAGDCSWSGVNGNSTSSKVASAFVLFNFAFPFANRMLQNRERVIVLKGYTVTEITELLCCISDMDTTISLWPG